MKERYSLQYAKPCIEVEEDDTADEVLAVAVKIGAFGYFDGPDEVDYVLVLREEVGPELWTEDVVRRSVGKPKGGQ